jgi:nucleotide-binding universal stress UspA family protein
VRLVKILLPIIKRGLSGACAAAAFSLTERFGASLEVLHPCPTPADRLPYATELSPLYYFDQLINVGKKQVSLEKRQAKKWLDKTGRGFPKVAPELLTIEGQIAPIVSVRAKVADLCVLPSIGAEADAFWSSARDAALFHSGRPLLVMPETWGGAIGETVVVAWKDSVEAVRAVAAARPFLREAKQVKLVSVAERGNEPNAAAMMGYLTKSGLAVELVELTTDTGDTGPILLEAATGRDVLLVMGAYGHWRWREFAFGGATDYVLRNTSVPALMMH